VPSASSLFQAAKKWIPSGVNSPVRAFRAVGGTPVFIRRGQGAHLWDEGGKRYLDFCASWGPLLFGHAPKGLIAALRSAIAKGTSFGAATVQETELARLIHTCVPSIQKCRLVSSGTEAVMSAIRLARGYTGRTKILKIDGGYHGHADSLLVKAGSGAATFGLPDSAGVPQDLAKHTLSVPFNDVEALERVFKRHGKDIAAFILEPVPANMGVIPPDPAYLALARLFTLRYGTLLIFDEVITGFRLTAGGAQDFYGITPDLTCLGKILGGGLPLAAFGGRGKIMDCLAPEGPVYQAGTLSGNPVAVTAALWMLKQIKRPGVLRQLNLKADAFFRALEAALERAGWPVWLNHEGSMFTLFFTPYPVTDYASAKKADTKRFARFFQACLKQGLYMAPSQFEANFISVAHTEKDLGRALTVFKKVLKKVC